MDRSPFAEGVSGKKAVGVENMVPVTRDSVQFKGGTLLLLAYGDNEPREMENTSGHVKFQNYYSAVHVQLSSTCKMWGSDVTSEDGDWLSRDIFVDTVEQKWHANIKVVNLFAPITVEKAVLEQMNSQYELQGHIESVISSMGRWRMGLEVPRAEIAEMLSLARLLSRSTDPALQFRSKDLFIQSIQPVGIDAESPEASRGNSLAFFSIR